MNAIFLFGGASIFLTLVLIILSPFFHSRKYADRTEAFSNIKEVHLALIDFDTDYGSFPNASTIPAVKAKTSTSLALGSSSSNELFRQLIASTAKTESIFWAKTSATSHRPDGDLTGIHALEKGECAFTYIAGLSSSSALDAPVAMVQVIPGTWEFDPKPFKGKAVVLRIDGSAKIETIDRNGHVMIGGMNIFDPRQPYWRGKTPDIKWPE